MDALASLLETVHLGGSLYFRSELGAPWGMEVPASQEAQFHVVRRGRCWVLPTAGSRFEARELVAGDIVVLPRGTGHVLADDPGTPIVPLMDLLPSDVESPQDLDRSAPLRHGGDGAQTTLICGFFTFDSGAAHPLLAVLPEVLHLKGEGGRARHWLELTLDLIADEIIAGRPGGEVLVNRLTETLFIQVLQSYIEDAEHPSPNWLAGLRDPSMARALGAIHSELDMDWSVATLAARAGMSRSAFSARFRELVGEPPMQYLTRWRMQVAANHLQAGRLTLGEIAYSVGYAAEASFSKVFKRFLGEAPGAYRKRALHSAH
jgi:AraC-like DNA-binding protein